VNKQQLSQIAAFACIAFTLSCQRQFERKPSTLDEPRVLAIGMDPPEAAAGKTVRVTALVAGPEGKIETPGTWSLCTQRPQVAGYNALADGCIEGRGTVLLGTRVSVDVVVPKDACAIFGSEPPSASGNEPPIRPFDADATGGYYQPLLVAVGNARASSGVRLSCALFQATADNARAYRERYVPNTNPVFREVTIPGSIERNQAVSLRVGVNAPESYVAYDPVRSALVERTERLELSWFVTKGGLREDTSFVSSEADAENAYVAPSESGTVQVFGVLRDDRGGASFFTRAIEVR
jgi:hypothetical protein